MSQTDPSTLERQALVALRKMRQKLDDVERARNEPIAIIGAGCRLPGRANSLESYWNLLRTGVDAISEIPADRWKLDDFFDARQGMPGKTYSRCGGFMDRIDLFDAEFFGISPREAVRMDPQQRVMMEVTWEALENAGIAPHSLKESNTGIFVGTTSTDYLQYQLQHGDPADLDAYIISGNTINATSGRLAYFLGTHGPSISMDTACSSSLVAVDRACRSIRDGECNLAIAAGVNLALTPEMFVCMSRWGMLSPDGRCKTFDAGADGFVRAEGCGVVILKRLKDAVSDGDRVLAIIRGSAVNQDGPSSGLSVPNGLAQEAVIRTALHNANIDPANIGYVEAHGTGTSLGDPIEVDALARIFKAGRESASPLALGSVKTNLGHLEAAAGITGLLKVVLMLQHRQIAPHLHLKKPSPHIAWEQYPFVIPTTLVDWNPINGRRIAGVSSFGFSGTNAHVIIEEAPTFEKHPTPRERPLHLLTLSARNPAALRTLTEQTAVDLAALGKDDFANVCFTANAGRSPFAHRVSVTSANSAEAGEKLQRYLAGENIAGLVSGRAPGKERSRIAFLFTGQGSQYANMGRKLFETSPSFRATLERCDELLRPQLERPLLSVLFPEEGAPLWLNETRYTQPALFVLEYALAELWRSWGIQPAFVMGHSVGEYVAACVAGIFSLEDGLMLIAARGRLMQAEPSGGRMVAVRAGEEQVRAALAPFARSVSIAAINGPRSTVISGAAAEVTTVLARLSAEGVAGKDLTVSHAFHSPLMDPMLAALDEVLAKVTFHPPKLRLISNLTGRVATAEEVSRPDYWRRHVREPVQFAGGIKALDEAGCDVFLELGPNPVLLGMGRQCVARENVLWLSTLYAGRDDWNETIGSLQALYHAGITVDWKGFDHEYPRRKLSLPTYPFQRERYWADPVSRTMVQSATRPASEAASHLLLGAAVRSPAFEGTVFQTVITAKNPGFLRDHQVHGRVIFPATAYIEMALTAAQRLWGDGPMVVTDIALQEALTLELSVGTLLQLILRPVGEGGANFEIFSSKAASEIESNWIRHVQGKVNHPVAGAAAMADDRVDLAGLQARCTEALDLKLFYTRLRTQGSEFGPEFCNLRRLQTGRAEAVAEIALSENLRSEASLYRIHPALLDGCFQSSVGAIPGGLDAAGENEVLLPVRIESVQLKNFGAKELWCHARLRTPTETALRTFITDLTLHAADGRVVGEVRGFEVKRVSLTTLRRVRSGGGGVDNWLSEISWRTTVPPENFSEIYPAWSKQTGTWLILADESGVSAGLREKLAAAGQHSLIARPGVSFAWQPEGGCIINPNVPADFKRLLIEGAARHSAPWRGVIHLWSLDFPSFEEMSGDDLASSQLLGCGAALHLVQAILGAEKLHASALWLVTRGAQPVTNASAPVQPSMASLSGLGRVIVTEHPELKCHRVDLDPLEKEDISRALFEEIVAGDSLEREVAFRQQTRFCPRLVRLPAASEGNLSSWVSRESVRLEVSSSRLLEDLRWTSAERKSPGRGEVEVQVKASGLNFRDVLCALGMYPDQTITIGGECAGVVSRVGDGVTGVQPGDRVMAFAPGSFGTYVAVRRDFVTAIPTGLDFVAAATIPVAFLTTLYGLHRLAGMKKGDRVLIHAAAGGVGLAAVQLAQQTGAEIFATVGSAEKRAYLTSIGVAHIFDSRSLSFADDVMRVTKGSRVDIVLNSLAGDFIARSISILAPGGRFLELGKRGILTPQEFAKLRPDCTYHAYDLGTEAFANPNLAPGLYRELSAILASGGIRPLPLTLFTAETVVDAFRYMAQAKHIGKIAVKLPDADPAVSPKAVIPPFRGDATYLITGGLGGLGLATARWMVREGARHLVLIGRRAPSTDASEVVSKLVAQGAHVSVEACDVSEEKSLSALLYKIATTMPPLRGVIHTAGMLDDRVLTEQSWARFETVMAPKIRGAWLLDRLTASCPLDFFVLFSAAAALIGSPGQGNYAAANSFMDALAHHRRRRGLVAVSINWGVWAEAGMAARLSAQNLQRLEQLGLRSIRLDEGMAQLGRILGYPQAQIVAVPADWARFSAAAGGVCPPLFSEMTATSGPLETVVSPVDVFASLLAEPAARRLAALESHIELLACKALGMSGRRSLDFQQPLHELGLDSLMSVELRNTLSATLGRPLPSTLLFDYPAVEPLARYLAREIFQWDLMESARQMPAEKSKQQDLQVLQQMSDSEAEALLLAELQQPKK